MIEHLIDYWFWIEVYLNVWIFGLIVNNSNTFFHWLKLDAILIRAKLGKMNKHDTGKYRLNKGSFHQSKKTHLSSHHSTVPLLFISTNFVWRAIMLILRGLSRWSGQRSMCFFGTSCAWGNKCWSPIKGLNSSLPVCIRRTAVWTPETGRPQECGS